MIYPVQYSVLLLEGLFHKLPLGIFYELEFTKAVIDLYSYIQELGIIQVEGLLWLFGLLSRPCTCKLGPNFRGDPARTWEFQMGD